jgi:hypothetical protein
MGGAIGVSSTILADMVRSRRERDRQLDNTRRELYSRYLQALTLTDAELQALAVSEETPVDEVKIREAWRGHSLLPLRYEVELVAPEAVSEVAADTYRCLRAMRNAIRTTELTVSNAGRAGGVEGSAEWEAVHRPYIEAIADLRTVMRSDIQRH